LFARIALKFLIPITVIAFFWMKIDMANRTFEPKAEPAKAQESEVDPFPAVYNNYTSHDMPRQETIEELITRYFPEDPSKAIKIAKCESSYWVPPVGWKPWSHNGTAPDDSWGLFQINLFGKLKLTRPSAEELKDPETNVKFARSI
jgi:hypothetical protein